MYFMVALDEHFLVMSAWTRHTVITIAGASHLVDAFSQLTSICHPEQNKQRKHEAYHSKQKEIVEEEITS